MSRTSASTTGKLFRSIVEPLEKRRLLSSTLTADGPTPVDLAGSDHRLHFPHRGDDTAQPVDSADQPVATVDAGNVELDAAGNPSDLNGDQQGDGAIDAQPVDGSTDVVTGEDSSDPTVSDNGASDVPTTCDGPAISDTGDTSGSGDISDTPIADGIDLAGPVVIDWTFQPSDGSDIPSMSPSPVDPGLTLDTSGAIDPALSPDPAAPTDPIAFDQPTADQAPLPTDTPVDNSAGSLFDVTTDASDPLGPVMTAGSESDTSATSGASDIPQTPIASSASSMSNDPPAASEFPSSTLASSPPAMTSVVHDVMNTTNWSSSSSHEPVPTPPTISQHEDRAPTEVASQEQFAPPAVTVTEASATSSHARAHQLSAVSNSSSTTATTAAATPFSNSQVAVAPATPVPATVRPLPTAEPAKVLTAEGEIDVTGPRTDQEYVLQTADERFKMMRVVWTFLGETPVRRAQASEQQQRAETAAAKVEQSSVESTDAVQPIMVELVQEIDVTPSLTPQQLAVAVANAQNVGKSLVKAPQMHAGVTSSLDDASSRTRNIVLAVAAGVTSLAVQWYRSQKRKLAAMTKLAVLMQFDPLATWLDDPGFHDE